MDPQVDAVLSSLIGGDRWSAAELTAARTRDLVVLDLGETSIVVACDSNAATGDKPGDYLKQDPSITGYSAAKVPLMEVLATGATPFLLVNTLCCDLQTTGVSILRGIRTLLDECGLNVLITGSDESNMPTVQTGLGVTVLGVAETASLRLGKARSGDEIWVVGRRRSGIDEDDYDEGDGGTASAHHVRAALGLPGVHEVLPVGSKGIAFEASELARIAGVGIRLRERTSTDLSLSAGASTCFLVSCDPRASSELARLGLPLELVGVAVSDERPR